MPRSGSTTLQHILARHRTELKFGGVLYPDLTPASAAHEPHISHQHLGEALDGRRPRREAHELLARLSDELARTDADTVLLSYEDFIQEKRAAAIADVLRTVFARYGFAMEAVIVVKPQSALLNSIYAHRMQLMRERRVFADFARSYERSGRFAYDRLAEPWVAVCSGAVRAVPLHDRRDVEPLVTRFFTQLQLWDRVAGILRADDLTRVENRSPGPVAVEVSRRLRAMRMQDRCPVRPREIMRAVERLAVARGFDQTQFKGVTPDLRRRLDDRYRSVNDRFAQMVWQQPWSNVMAPEPDHAMNEIASLPADPKRELQIASILSDVCRSFGVLPAHPRTGSLAEIAFDCRESLAMTLRWSRWRVH